MNFRNAYKSSAEFVNYHSGSSLLPSHSAIPPSLAADREPPSLETAYRYMPVTYIPHVQAASESFYTESEPAYRYQPVSP